jgi:hypothetical protein
MIHMKKTSRTKKPGTPPILRAIVGIAAMLAALIAVAALSKPAAAGSPEPGDTGTAPATTAPDTDQATVAYTYTTVITVTSSADDGGTSQTCATTPCTLRRAINQARGLSAAARPVLIAFDLPYTDTGYATGVWVIQVASANSGSEVFAFRDFGTSGRVIVDGRTQPRGRAWSSGPRVFLRGDNQKGVFTLTGGNNTVRWLGFQGFGDRMVSIPGTSSNLVEYNWFGLWAAGDAIFLRDTNDAEKGSGEAGIYAQSGGTTNTVQLNILAGLDQAAIAMDSDRSYVLSNTVGTRADGTLPAVRWNRSCHPNARYDNWFGGAGIKVTASNVTVRGNRVAGLLYQSADPFSTAEDAISVSGRGNVVRENTIGLQSGNLPFGVCGEGIFVGGAAGAHSIQVLTNTIAGSGGKAGILVTGGQFGYDLNAVTSRANTIKANPVNAFAFGDTVPANLKNFNPAAVTGITGTAVTGSAGAGSPCANCRVELFLDVIDTLPETRQSFGVVTANAAGNWSATLPRTLAITEGLRTASTTVVDGQITHPSGVYSAGTTSKLSGLYTRPGAPAPMQPVAPPWLVPLAIPPVVYLAPPTQPSGFKTVITVTSAADPDDSAYYTCYANPPGSPVPAPDGKCTLRRAIVEATSVMAVMPSARPVLIRFTIPTSDPGYSAADGAWIIQITSTLQTNALPALGSTDVSKSGWVVISGTTQPNYGGNRASAPRIVVRGPAGGTKTGLMVNGDNNVIDGLAFQTLKDMLILNHDDNIVSANWFGLAVNGQGVHRRNPAQPQEGSGSGGVKGSDGADHNWIYGNAMLGLSGNAINLAGGNDNLISANFAGTRANGTIDKALVSPANVCKPDAPNNNWFGGGGFLLQGLRNRVTNNVLVGLLIQGGSLQTPPHAIGIQGGQDNLVQGNRIGRDALGADVWTCGRGVDINAPFSAVYSNTIVNSYWQAVFVDKTYTANNANTVRWNVAMSATTAIGFGNLVPFELVGFNPARITAMRGTHVTGTHGLNSLCPYCWVDVYLDDGDATVESLAHLGTAIADANGNWTLTLPAPLVAGQGLRTVSTTRDYGVIANFEAGTSTQMSALYSNMYKNYLPLVRRGS